MACARRVCVRVTVDLLSERQGHHSSSSENALWIPLGEDELIDIYLAASEVAEICSTQVRKESRTVLLCQQSRQVSTVRFNLKGLRIGQCTRNTKSIDQNSAQKFSLYPYPVDVTFLYKLNPLKSCQGWKKFKSWVHFLDYI